MTLTTLGWTIGNGIPLHNSTSNRITFIKLNDSMSDKICVAVLLLIPIIIKPDVLPVRIRTRDHIASSQLFDHCSKDFLMLSVIKSFSLTVAIYSVDNSFVFLQNHPANVIKMIVGHLSF